MAGRSKPANQGSAGSPKIQPSKKSSKPGKGGEAPKNAQKLRGFKTAGKGGSKPGPKPFKG